MKRQFRLVILAFSGALALSACATTVPGPARAAVSASPSAPAAAAPASGNAPKVFGNYVRVVRGGQTLYCQKDADTSTRMVHETCLTQAQAEAQQENARNFMQGAQGIATTPVAGPNAR